MAVTYLSDNAGEIVLTGSHVDEGWIKKWGTFDKPVNYVSGGFAVGVVLGGPRAAGAVVHRQGSRKHRHGRRAVAVQTRAEVREVLIMAINKKQVVDNLSKLRVAGGANGLIEAFGVLVNQLPSTFWNGFAERLTMNADPDMLAATEYLLVNAAHECGYHTGYGIITSDEWNAVVKPMVAQVPEDVLYGAFAVLAALGWANGDIVELVPEREARLPCVPLLRGRRHPRGSVSQALRLVLLRGITAAFMDLAYGGPYHCTGKTGVRTFSSVQTKGMECGDDYA